ncbi:MAG TPA: hypothetical protein CFH82_04630 [Sulfurospirillum sp. UBA12182]|jgi:hypothetical protein|nr:MAG TPA: hypothetical protein CFH82_04630 [Sulfurospirillum sp. UBA12182]
MKLFKSILLLACAFTFSFGEDYKELNSKTMIGMESGLSNIQKGFLYNNLELVKYGAEQIKAENKIYHERKVIKEILPKGKQQMENIALITSNRIDNAIEELTTYVTLKDMRKAHDAFTDIVKACTDCHNIVRGW